MSDVPATRPARTTRVRAHEVDDPPRRTMPAGVAVVVVLLTLALGALFNAQGLRKQAHVQPDGAAREVALALTRPLAAVSGALQLDEPRATVKRAIGRSEDDRLASGPSFAGGQPAPAPPAATVNDVFTATRKLRLLVAGDSLVVTPGESLIRIAEDTGAVQAVAPIDGRVATGLARPDVFDWYAHLRRELRRLRPDAVVVSFGANDDKDFLSGVPDGVELDGFAGPAWSEEYRRRVRAVLDLVARDGRVLVWIGLPITADGEQSARFDRINRIVFEEARRRRARVGFVDTYSTFAGPDGGYTPYVESADGARTKVRRDDGVHFAGAGGDLVAEAVLAELRRLVRLRG